jgi:sugar-specific transcriptional regulator TrmB
MNSVTEVTKLPSDVQTLSRLGLTVNQSKVYLFLAKAGMATARNISQKTGVARPDIYRVTLGLEKLGLIEKTISIPVRFKAIAINQALSALMNRRNKETMALQKKSEEIASRFKNKSQNETLEQNNNQFLIIPTKEANMKKRLTLIHNTQNNASVISSQKSMRTVSNALFQELLAALQRSVNIKVLTEIPGLRQSTTGTVKEFMQTGNFEMRYLDYCPAILLAIFDNNEALIVAEAGAGLTESPALWTNNLGLVTALQGYFEMLWLKSIQRDDPTLTSPI